MIALPIRFTSTRMTFSRSTAPGAHHVAVALARYNPDGSLDPAFGSGGTATYLTPTPGLTDGSHPLLGEDEAMELAVSEIHALRDEKRAAGRS